jgi:hypothetical protein
MQDYFPAIVITLLGAGALLFLASRYSRREAFLLGASYFAHVISGILQVVITLRLYGGGDIFGYARMGEEVAAAVRMDFQTVGWELLRLLFQQQANLPVVVNGVGSSTGSMVAVSAIISLITGGGLYTGCVALGVAAFFGKVALYETFRRTCVQRLRTPLLLSALLVPSVVFWSSGLLKESVAMVGLGPMLLGGHRLFEKRTSSGIALVLVGGVIVGLLKPYILFAFTLAGGAWLYCTLAWDGRIPQLRPVHLVAGMALAVFGVALLSRLFPRYALDTFAEQAAYHQEIGQRVRGGSTYELVTESEANVSVQLAYAPLALLTSLYRPLVFEASNAQILFNALETSVLLTLSVLVLWRSSLRSLWRALLETPMAVFSLTFVVVFGVAVGLTTTNLGTLSRYRMPLVPFFAALLAILLDAAKTLRASSAPTAQLPRRGALRVRPSDLTGATRRRP